MIGIHTPPIGPYPDWTDDDLSNGRKIYGAKEKGRGPKTYYSKGPDGSKMAWHGHPIYALQPNENNFGTVADYCSLSVDRDWFIKKITNPKAGVRAVFSGHIHRNGLYYIETPAAKDNKGVLTGRMLVKSLFRPFKPSLTPNLSDPAQKTLYVNTTSSGPRGGFYVRKETDAESQRGGLSIDPGYSRVDMAKNGDITSVKFLFVKG
jgi:hypothetical protein